MADRALGDDPDLILSEVLDVVLHLGGEEVRPDPETAPQRQRVVADPVGLVEHPAVHDPREHAVDDADQAVFVPDAMDLPAEEFGEEARGDDIVEVAVEPREGLDDLQHPVDLIARRLPDDHDLAAREQDRFRRVGRHLLHGRAQHGFQFVDHAFLLGGQVLAGIPVVEMGTHRAASARTARRGRFSPFPLRAAVS